MPCVMFILDSARLDNQVPHLLIFPFPCLTHQQYRLGLITKYLFNTFTLSLLLFMLLHCGSVVKNLPASAGDAGSIPGLGRSPGEGNGNPLQYSCLENPMERGAWRGAVHGVPKSQCYQISLTTNFCSLVSSMQPDVKQEFNRPLMNK